MTSSLRSDLNPPAKRSDLNSPANTRASHAIIRQQAGVSYAPTLCCRWVQNWRLSLRWSRLFWKEKSSLRNLNHPEMPMEPFLSCFLWQKRFCFWHRDARDALWSVDSTQGRCSGGQETPQLALWLVGCLITVSSKQEARVGTSFKGYSGCQHHLLLRESTWAI